jgi:hypothetical protein
VAATFIAKLLNKYRWIGYVGLVIVLYVALHMIWDGYRSVVVRTGNLEPFNAAAPAFIDISAEEVDKFMKGVRSEDSHLPGAGAPLTSPDAATSSASAPPPVEVASPEPAKAK